MPHLGSAPRARKKNPGMYDVLPRCPAISQGYGTNSYKPPAVEIVNIHQYPAAPATRSFMDAWGEKKKIKNRGSCVFFDERRETLPAAPQALVEHLAGSGWELGGAASSSVSWVANRRR